MPRTTRTFQDLLTSEQIAEAQAEECVARQARTAPPPSAAGVMYVRHNPVDRSMVEATSRFFRERAEIANHQIFDGIQRPVIRRLDDTVQEVPLPERGRIPQGNTEGWTTQDCISWANANPPNQDSPTVRFVAYKLAAAVGELESELAKAKESESVALAANELLTKELKHWQSNHATEVRRARILKERPDLPIDRIQAYEAWGEDLAELAVLREEVAATKKEVP